MPAKPQVIDTLPHDIGPLWGRAPEAIRGEIILAPSAYNWLSYGLQGGASDNWDEVYVALELVNLQRSQPIGTSAPRLAEFLRVQLANRRFMQKEFGSWVYLEMHAGPRIVQYGVARLLAERDPGTWRPIADGLRGWLRALVGWLAYFGCWGPGRNWGAVVGSEGPGARLLVGKGAYSIRTGEIPWCTLTGKRSWDYKGDWRDNVFAPAFLWALGLGHRDGRGDIMKAILGLIAAVEGWLGGPLVILTREEEARVLTATHNDLAALRWVVEHLIGDWLPAEPIVGVRTVRGVSCTMLEAAKSATAAMQHCGWTDDGTTYAAGADNGLRGGRGEQIEETMAAVDLVTRTGFCQRTTGPDRVRVNFPLPPGELVSVLHAQHGKGLQVSWWQNGQEVRDPVVPLPPVDHGGVDPTRPETQRERKSRF